MTQETQATQEAKGTNYTTVTMDDGRVVEFAGKRKLLKESTLHADGGVTVRLDFLNGETRSFDIPSNLMQRFAAHGAEQKLGDEIAGVADVDDCVLAVDELVERLKKGEWGITRTAGNSIAGTSVLARALAEHSGKPMDTIKAFLRDKTQAQKLALRNNPAVNVIVARLEAEKAKKSTKSSVDTEALLGELA